MLQKGVNNSVELLTLVFAVWFLNVEIIMKMEIEIFIYNCSYLNKQWNAFIDCITVPEGTACPTASHQM